MILDILFVLTSMNPYIKIWTRRKVERNFLGICLVFIPLQSHTYFWSVFTNLIDICLKHTHSNLLNLKVINMTSSCHSMLSSCSLSCEIIYSMTSSSSLSSSTFTMSYCSFILIIFHHISSWYSTSFLNL